MAKPVITTPISPRIIAAGVPFSQAMVASGSPTGWAASGLPSGLTIHPTTGLISGSPLSQIQTTSGITATNGDGTSDAVQIIWVVMATPPGMGGPFDVVVDFEMTTNEVTLPGVEAVAGQPLFYAPSGTNRFLLVGITYFGVLQDINPEAEPISIKIGMKELEPDRLLEVTTAAATKVVGVTPDRQRYRIPFRVTPSHWVAALSDYEADAGTSISALTELQVSRGLVATLHDATLTDSAIGISSGIVSAITGDHDFTGLEAFAVATPMRLTLTLSVAGRPLQTVSLVREFAVVFAGGVFAISALTGPTTGTGASEGGKWRATLNLTSLTGDANSIDADYSITTSANTSQYVVLPDWGDPAISSARGLQLYAGSPGMEAPLGAVMGFSDGDLDPSDVAAKIQTAWQSASGVSDVVSVTWTTSPYVFRVEFANSSPVTGYEWAETITGAFSAPTPAAPASTCSVSARLQQLEAPSSLPLNLTSNPFRIGVARDMVPD